jgi:hypothetical protein
MVLITDLSIKMLPYCLVYPTEASVFALHTQVIWALWQQQVLAISGYSVAEHTREHLNHLNETPHNGDQSES